MRGLPPGVEVFPAAQIKEVGNRSIGCRGGGTCPNLIGTPPSGDAAGAGSLLQLWQHREARVKMRQELGKSQPSRGGVVSPQVITDEVEPAQEGGVETPEEGREALECEPVELPSCNEETKVVLLAVNPYLVHVYWTIAAHDQEEVGRVFSRLGPRAQPVLRFYDITHVNFEATNTPSCFDVEIALGAGNWYVHLESPAKVYCVDLGFRIVGGGFRCLARSNVAETPRASPSDREEESYLLVKGESPRAESVVPPEAASEKRGGASPCGPKASSPRLQEGFAPPPVAQAKGGPQAGGESRSATTYSEPQGTETKGPEPKELRVFRTAAPGEIERKLVELYQHSRREVSGSAPKDSSTGEPRPAGKKRADFTEMSERSFRAGQSSGQKPSSKGG